MSEENGVIIYEITSPSGKCYVGKTVEWVNRANGKNERKGLRGRWLQHVRSVKYPDSCGAPLLKRAINKYGHENFTKRVLVRTTEQYAEFFEELCIRIRDSLTPKGYNLQSGGKHCRMGEETKKKMSETMKRKLKDPKILAKWRKPKVKRRRKIREDNILPKYICAKRYKDVIIGYIVVDHPTKKNKSWCSKVLSNEEKLRLATKYLNEPLTDSNRRHNK